MNETAYKCFSDLEIGDKIIGITDADDMIVLGRGDKYPVVVAQSVQPGQTTLVLKNVTADGSGQLIFSDASGFSFVVLVEEDAIYFFRSEDHPPVTHALVDPSSQLYKNASTIVTVSGRVVKS